MADGWKSSKQILNVSRELQCVREEKETLLMSGAQSSAGREELLSAVASLTAERDQLKMDLQENVEMVSYRATALPVQILNAFISISCVGPLLCAFCL